MAQDDRGQLSFNYDEAWRDIRGSYPSSLSMPLAALEHRHDAISAYIWGLLPDNEGVLDRWAKKFQVSARNPFALIANVGEDCAGAVQVVRPERTRYDKRDDNVLASVQLASIRIWLRQNASVT